MFRRIQTASDLSGFMLCSIVSFVALQLGCDDNLRATQQGADVWLISDSDVGSQADSRDSTDFADDPLDDIGDNGSLEVNDDNAKVDATLPGCEALEFRAVEFSPMLSMSAAELVSSEEDFRSLFGEAPPAELLFGENWAIVHANYSEGEAMGTQEKVIEVDLCPANGRSLSLITESVSVGCDTLSYQPTGLVLLIIPALQAPEPSCCSEIGIDPKVLSCAQGGVEAESCTRESLCRNGLICVGLTLDNEGVCQPSSTNWGIFENFDAIAIPDASPGATSVNTIVGLNGVVADVVVGVTVDHPRFTDLRVTLVTPDGQQATVWEHQQVDPTDPPHLRSAVHFSSPVGANGVWSLRITDTLAGEIGELDRWSLEITTRSVP